jgi:hypothetical protein
VTGTVVNLDSSDSNPRLFGFLTVLFIAIVVAAPPAIYAVTRRRRRAAE